MAYSTLDDLKKNIPEAVIIQLTDDAGTGEIVQDKIDEAITSADGEIDGYLATRYTVPLDPIPALISKFSADIAIYNLYSRVAETIPDTRSDRYKNAIRTLEKISEGKIRLGGETEPPAKAQASASFVAPERLFTREKLRDM
ncbi:MAG: DUF1320 domain-containing protein [Pseudomonadota bacterium]